MTYLKSDDTKSERVVVPISVGTEWYPAARRAGGGDFAIRVHLAEGAVHREVCCAPGRAE